MKLVLSCNKLGIYFQNQNAIACSSMIEYFLPKPYTLPLDINLTHSRLLCIEFCHAL
jgi:hypothetical protein